MLTMNIKKYLFACLLLIIANMSAKAQDEILNVPWPTEYKWKVLSDTTVGIVHMTEYIPAKENKDNWTLKTVMVILSNPELHTIPMDTNMKMMAANAKRGAPKARVTVLEENDTASDPYVFFTVETPYFDKDPKPLSQLFYVIEGKNGQYFSYISIKEPKLTQSFIEKWSKFLRQAELMYK